MLKTTGYVDFQGKKIEKLWVEGSIIKGDIRNNTLIINLASYKGKDVTPEYTNNIMVTDEKKAAIIKGLKKGTQLFCEVNITHKQGEKTYDNLYLFNFVIGKEGKGGVLIDNQKTAQGATEEEYY